MCNIFEEFNIDVNNLVTFESKLLWEVPYQ